MEKKKSHAAQLTLLKNVRIVDTITGEAREPLDLLVADDKIGDIGKALETDGDSVSELDCGGRYAIPGLFDCHTHLTALTDQPVDVQREIFDECALSVPFQEGGLAELVLPDFLRRGVTQVRDLGGPVKTLQKMDRRAVEQKSAGPSVFYAGPMLEMPPLTIAGMNERWPGWTVAVESADRVAEIADGLASDGASCLKVFGRFKSEPLKALLAQAERNGIPVTCDPGTTFFHDVDILKGIDLGIRCFEHAKSLWYSVLKDDLREEHDRIRSEGPEIKKAFIERVINAGPESISISKLNDLAGHMVETGTLLCPTLHISKFYSEKPEVFNDREPEKYRPVFRALYEAGRVVVSVLAKHGVRMLVGQDGYIPRFTFEEMLLLAGGSLSAKEILKGATIYAAEWFGMADRYGSLEVGKKASLAVLDNNPAEDVRHFQAINLVMHEGEVVFSQGVAES
jgi:imidazolonepropionase-like amidohydrolase